MDDIKTLNRRYETVAWGALLILLGVDFFVPGLLVPYGIGMLGIGIILLGLNLARRLSHIPMNGFTIALGVLTLVEGVVALVRGLLGIQVKLPFFPTLLIGIGVILIIRVAAQMKSATTLENG